MFIIYYLFCSYSNEAIKCSADTEAFEVYKKLPEPNKSVVEYISNFLYNLSKHSKATSLNETSLASLFAPCLMRHTSTDIKEMIAASEKQASFVLALLDAAAAGLIPGSLFERSVGACNSDDNGESNSTGLESEVSCDTKWVSPARTPMSTPPPPLRPVNCTKGELLPTPLRVKRIPPQPTNPPPLPPELEKK